MNVPIPVQLAHLPTHAGMVVPFITSRHLDGTPAFGQVDRDLVATCLASRRCQLCAAELEDVAVILARPQDFAQGYVDEPAQHSWCAAYAIKTCPMLSGRLPKHRDRTLSKRGCGDPGCWCTETVTGPDNFIRANRPATPWYSVRIPMSDYRVIDSARKGPRGLSLKNLRNPKIRLVSRGRPETADLGRILMFGLPW